MSIQRIDVTYASLAEEIGTMSAEELDALPFGAIKLDHGGTILAYNKAEERFAGRKAADVLGRNFFRDVAPCTRVRRFHGAFEAGVARRELNEVFDFTFHFPTGTRDVRIRMVYNNGMVWIFVTPMSARETT